MPTLAGDSVGIEMHADSPVIIFADKYVSDHSMIHLWAVPGVQTNLLFRMGSNPYKILKKCEFGLGPSFAIVDDHEVWAYYDLELDTKIQLGQLTWIGYRLGQLARYNSLQDNSLLREQLFWGDFPLGVIGNNLFADSAKPRWFWGAVYSLGRTAYFGTNKIFITVNLANTNEVWAAWLLEI